MPRTHNNLALVFVVGVSAFGLLMVLALSLNPVAVVHENFPERKPLIGSIFSAICIFGMFASLFPKQCSGSSHFRKRKNDSAATKTHATLKGHHPECEEFSAHIIEISNYTLCAACTGLLLGALMALTGTVFYFFNGWSIETLSFQLVLFGITGITLGFFQLKFKGFIRLGLNMLFVLGAFFVLIGIDALVQSVLADFFLIVLIVFWLLTRIQLSHWDHFKICLNCKSPCQIGSAEKK